MYKWPLEDLELLFNHKRYKEIYLVMAYNNSKKNKQHYKVLLS